MAVKPDEKRVDGAAEPIWVLLGGACRAKRKVSARHIAGGTDSREGTGMCAEPIRSISCHGRTVLEEKGRGEEGREGVGAKGFRSVKVRRTASAALGAHWVLRRAEHGVEAR